MKHFVLAIALLFSLAATAQRRHNKPAVPPVPPALSAEKIAANYADSLKALAVQFTGWRNTAPDTLSNPYYAAIFGASTLYDNVLKRSFSLTPPEHSRFATSPDGQNAHIYAITEATDRTLLSLYTLAPQLVSRVQDEGEIAHIETPATKEIKPEVKLSEKLEEKLNNENTAAEGFVATDDWHIVVRKPNFWTFKGSFSLQFTQNYVSDNWYKGGENNNTLLGQLNLEANYNNKQKVTFDNRLEMKLGFQTSENDKEHKYKTNSDLIRLTNKLGLRAVKNWYYTIKLESWTQFYHGYKSNDTKVYSDFMSPFESLLSIGMDFKPSFKKFSMSAVVSPLALRMKYVDRESLITSFGLDEGKHAKWDYGSNITINYNWNIVKNVSWSGRIYWFTDYTLTQFEWENTFNFKINRFLSTKLFLYPRFDDNRKREEGKSYWQFYEMLSLGLNLSF